MFSSNNSYMIFVDFSDNNCTENKDRYLNEVLQKIKNHSYLLKEQYLPLDIIITYTDYSQIFDLYTIYSYLKLETETDSRLSFKITMNYVYGYTVQFFQAIHKTINDIFPGEQTYFNLNTHSVVFCSKSYVSQYILGKFSQGEPLSPVYQEKLNQEVYKANDTYKYQKHLAKIFNSIINYKKLICETKDEQNNTEKRVFIVNPCDFDEYTNYVEFYDAFLKENIDINKYIISSTDVEYEVKYYLPINFKYSHIPITTNTVADWVSGYTKNRNNSNIQIYNLSVGDTYEDGIQIDNIKYYLPIVISKLKTNSPCYINITISERNSNLSRIERLISCLPYDILNKITINKSPIRRPPLEASDIFPIIILKNINDLSNNDTFNLIEKKYFDYISNYENYKGTNESIIRGARKKDISKLIISNVIEKQKNMSHLAYVIFLYMLRNLLERKELFKTVRSTLSNTNEKVDEVQKYIREDIIDKAFVDAQSYANGIFQLIENACEHSCGKQAVFGMRIHNADRNAPPNSFEKETKTLAHLMAKYNDKDITNMFYNRSYSDYIEFFVLDDATNYQGIVPKFNQSTVTKIGICEIEDIIHMTEETYQELAPSNSDLSLYYTQHYGLRWFEQIVSKNNGLFMISSPNEHSTSYYPTNRNVENTNGISYFTEYNILIPLSYVWESSGQNNTNAPEINIVSDEDIQSENVTFLSLSNSEWHNIFLNGSDKNSKINLVYDYFESIRSDQAKLKWYIDFCNKQYPSVEILAKSIFKLIFELRHNSDKRVLIAIDFGNQHTYVSEFVRIFAVFYGKLGNNLYMENIQIALCSESQLDNNNKEVNFVIAGKDIISAYTTADAFLYYNSESTYKYTHLLRYLVGDIKNKTDVKSVSIFPFDLYLKNCRQDECWFLDRMKSVLNNDISKYPYGCKISNTHIRISSRIHLNDFYEAELLFHNLGNVYRFAYLIASDILKVIKYNCESQTILLVGYENYSAILVQQIKKFIGQSGSKIICAALVTEGEKNETHLEIVSGDLPQKEPQRLLCYTIVPITTTMSTVYKIHNIVKKNIQQRDLDPQNVVFERNYSIIAVCDRLESTQKDKIDFSDKDIPYCYYWSSISPYEKIVYLKPELSTSSDSCSVKYYLSASSKWNDSENCKINTGHIEEYAPLIQVDKTSTLPKAIFELKENNRKKAFKTNNTDEQRLSALKPQFKSKKARVLLRYSHLCRGNNHYQFYFDFDKYVETKKEDIINWAEQIKLDRNSYNIVISPLSISNSQFLHIILEKSFVSSLRFLHIDITNTYKDDARAKFSYIAKELESIRSYNPNAIFNFYYVDDSIVTGTTLNRARTIMRMIIDQAGIGTTNVALFKKIFLLINRSSYETMNTYVENPQEDIYVYLNLMIPSYNTTENLCPACYVKQRYQLLRKRSATISLSRNFARLEQKHSKKTPDKYDQWLEQEIINNHSYFAWLKLWLYYFPHDEHNKNLGSPKSCEELKNDIIDFMKKQVAGINYSTLEGEEAYLSTISSLNLNDFLCDKPQKKSFVVELMKYIVAERAYVRLETMNKAYNTLFDVVQANNATDYSDLVDITTKRILSLLNDCCENSKINYYGKFETIISYIKVISREHLSNYYHIRTAIVQVMLNLLNILNGEAVEPGYSTISQTIRYNHCGKRSFSTTPCASLQYQLFTTICHRLALLQCSIVYEPQFVNSIFNRYTDLRQKYFGETYDLNCAPEYSLQLTELLPSNQVAERYAASIKTATMLTNDDSACYNLLSNFEKIPDDNEMICQIKKVLKLENTRVFFDFMRELDERLNRERCREKYTGEGGLKHRYTLLSKEENKIDTIINESIQGNEILKQNPFSKYIRFWQRYYNLSPNIADVDTIHSTFTVPITKMFHYFRTVRYLSEMSYENLAQIHNNLPYLYEDICISMADATNHQMCYIFMKNKRDMEIQKISQSGYYCGEDAYFQDEILLTKRFAQLLNSIDDRNHSRDLTKTRIKISEGELKHVIDCIYSFKLFGSPNKSKNNKNILSSTGKIISLPYSLHEGELNSECCFYIVLQEYIDLESNEKPDVPNDLESMEKILFLRDSLMQILQRDYAVLINFRYDCSYIKSLSNISFSKDSSRNFFPSILHISDIHIDGNPLWGRDGKHTKSICEALSKGLIEQKIPVPDLIAVTGDVIQGSSVAMSAQDRYEMVSDYLKEISLVLWGNNNFRIPHDWKRRILIVPGNHDYLTMNELSAITKSRKTKYAEPVQYRSGTTMIKFTYYIEFLQKFLDAPIDLLVANGLNEVRHYENLNTSIIMLNSAAVANSLQNNKVGFETNVVEQITSTSQWTKNNINHICITHHAKSYEINYMDDIYSPWKIEEKAQKQEVGSDLISGINQLIKYYFKLVDNFYLNEIDSQKIDQFMDCYARYQKDIRINELFDYEVFEDIQQLYELLCSRSKNLVSDQDEFSLQLKSRLFTMKKTACDDSDKFTKDFETIKNSVASQKIIYLAGHEHKCIPKEKEVTLDTENVFVIGKSRTCFSIIFQNSQEHVKRILFEF